MKSPLVSVIISTYNRTHYLQQAIKSVLSQTLTDFEVLVCDDASANPAEVLAAIPDDLRFKLLSASYNVGMAANNARGYKLARGKYLAHLDDDDLWHPDYLRRLITSLEDHPNCSLAFCNHLVIDGRGQPNLNLTRYGESKWGRADLVEGEYQPFWDLAVIRRAIPVSHAAVIRRDVLGDLVGLAEATYAWDLFLSYRASRKGHAAYFIPERLAMYRIHDTRASSAITNLESYRGLIYCDRAVLGDADVVVERSLISTRLARVTAFLVVALLRLGHRDEAKKLLRDIPLSRWTIAANGLVHMRGGAIIARLAIESAALLRQRRIKKS